MDTAPFRICRNRTILVDPLKQSYPSFAAEHALSFAEAFEPAFLDFVVAEAAAARFVDDVVEQLGSRRVELPQRVGLAISLALHRPAFLDWVETATGTAPLRAVAGRLVETRANGQDALDWHDDSIAHSYRKLAVVIDLSDRKYRGGRFQLRRKGEERTLIDFEHPGPGSMLIFAIGPQIEHRVTSVLSGGPRRVFAGWFLSRPEFETRSLGAGLKPVDRL